MLPFKNRHDTILIHGHQRCSSRVVRERYGQGILSSARHPMTGQAQLLPILKCNRPNLTLCVLEPPALDARVLRDTTDSVEGIPRVGSSPALGPTWTGRSKSKITRHSLYVCTEYYPGTDPHLAMLHLATNTGPPQKKRDPNTVAWSRTSETSSAAVPTPHTASSTLLWRICCQVWP